MNLIGSSAKFRALLDNVDHGRAGGLRRPHSGRNRHRQGSDCPCDSRGEPPAQEPFRGAQLRRDSECSAGERTFGHEKGAFTGAVAQTIGRFQAADRGTLFLDEIGDLPLELQPKLLRALQEKQFERLGGGQTLQVDVRVIAATNQDLGRMVQ